MKTAERELLKEAKADHKKALKNKPLYKQNRDAIIAAIIESRIPKWGSLKVIVTPL